jgi:hypothetical protein
MSLKTLEIPNSVPVQKAVEAWGLDPNAPFPFSGNETLSSHEIRKFLMATTKIIYPGKSKPAFKEYFVRFMVLSLKYPLIEDTEKAVLQMFDRDYLNPDDMELFRNKVQEIWNSIRDGKQKDHFLEYFEKSQDEYIAQFPRRVLLDTLHELPKGSKITIQSKIKQMSVNLLICTQKMDVTLTLIPIVDRVSREILDSNPMMKSINPIIGSLRMRRPVANIHTKLAVGG